MDTFNTPQRKPRNNPLSDFSPDLSPIVKANDSFNFAKIPSSSYKNKYSFLPGIAEEPSFLSNNNENNSIEFNDIHAFSLLDDSIERPKYTNTQTNGKPIIKNEFPEIPEIPEIPTVERFPLQDVHFKTIPASPIATPMKKVHPNNSSQVSNNQEQLINKVDNLILSLNRSLEKSIRVEDYLIQQQHQHHQSPPHPTPKKPATPLTIEPTLASAPDTQLSPVNQKPISPNQPVQKTSQFQQAMSSFDDKEEDEDSMSDLYQPQPLIPSKSQEWPQAQLKETNVKSITPKKDPPSYTSNPQTNQNPLLSSTTKLGLSPYHHNRLQNKELIENIQQQYTPFVKESYGKETLQNMSIIDIDHDRHTSSHITPEKSNSRDLLYVSKETQSTRTVNNNNINNQMNNNSLNNSHYNLHNNSHNNSHNNLNHNSQHTLQNQSIQPHIIYPTTQQTLPVYLTQKDNHSFYHTNQNNPSNNMMNNTNNNTMNNHPMLNNHTIRNISAIEAEIQQETLLKSIVESSPLKTVPIGTFYALVIDRHQNPLLVPVANEPNILPNPEKTNSMMFKTTFKSQEKDPLTPRIFQKQSSTTNIPFQSNYNQMEEQDMKDSNQNQNQSLLEESLLAYDKGNNGRKSRGNEDQSMLNTTQIFQIPNQTPTSSIKRIRYNPLENSLHEESLLQQSVLFQPNSYGASSTVKPRSKSQPRPSRPEIYPNSRSPPQPPAGYYPVYQQQSYPQHYSVQGLGPIEYPQPNTAYYSMLPYPHPVISNEELKAMKEEYYLPPDIQTLKMKVAYGQSEPSRKFYGYSSNYSGHNTRKYPGTPTSLKNKLGNLHYKYMDPEDNDFGASHNSEFWRTKLAQREFSSVLSSPTMNHI